MWEDIKSILLITREVLSVAASQIILLMASIFNPVIGITLFLYTAVQTIAKSLTGNEIELGKLKEMYNSLNAAVLSGTFGAFPAPVQPFIMWVNYWFPLSEMLIMVGILSGMYVLSATIRIIKAFIPTIA